MAVVARAVVAMEVVATVAMEAITAVVTESGVQGAIIPKCACELPLTSRSSPPLPSLPEHCEDERR